MGRSRECSLTPGLLNPGLVEALGRRLQGTSPSCTPQALVPAPSSGSRPPRCHAAALPSKGEELQLLPPSPVTAVAGAFWGAP